MNEALFGVAIAALSVGATYFFCVRPMRRNVHAMAGASPTSCHPAGSAELSEAERLKAEIAALRESADSRTTPHS